MFSEHSVMPVWVQIAVTLVTAAMLFPMVIVIAIPLIAVAPATLPFVAFAFAGDAHEESEVVHLVLHPPRAQHRFRVSLVGGLAYA
ncbi:MAG: hypothetical protein H6726_12735 [Sandaracinaceae bacterium]|nr:hypothetical protein [Sandaracinaceae bacterium]